MDIGSLLGRKRGKEFETGKAAEIYENRRVKQNRKHDIACSNSKGRAITPAVYSPEIAQPSYSWRADRKFGGAGGGGRSDLKCNGGGGRDREKGNKEGM